MPNAKLQRLYPADKVISQFYFVSRIQSGNKLVDYCILLRHETLSTRLLRGFQRDFFFTMLLVRVDSARRSNRGHTGKRRVPSVIYSIISLCLAMTGWKKDLG